MQSLYALHCRKRNAFIATIVNMEEFQHEIQFCWKSDWYIFRISIPVVSDLVQFSGHYFLKMSRKAAGSSFVLLAFVMILCIRETAAGPCNGKHE